MSDTFLAYILFYYIAVVLSMKSRGNVKNFV